MPAPSAFTSVSTWFTPTPARRTGQRDEVVRSIARHVADVRPGRVVVGVDGRTGAGKTSFGHELATALRGLGRSTLRASLDDFKRPWVERHRYDRESGSGYYHNAQDQSAIVGLLLRPSRPDGDGRVVLCSIDPLTQRDHTDVVVTAPDDGVLVVDGVFALRRAYRGLVDVGVWLEVDAATSLARGVDRDADREGKDRAVALHRDRYAVSDALHLATDDPATGADVVIDNTDLNTPVLVRLGRDR